jgi:hypothetical protein
MVENGAAILVQGMAVDARVRQQKLKKLAPAPQCDLRLVS